MQQNSRRQMLWNLRKRIVTDPVMRNNRVTRTATRHSKADSWVSPHSFHVQH